MKIVLPGSPRVMETLSRPDPKPHTLAPGRASPDFGPSASEVSPSAKGERRVAAWGQKLRKVNRGGTVG